MKRKYLYDNLKFEHKAIESALYNNVITYSQKVENKRNTRIVIYKYWVKMEKKFMQTFIILLKNDTRKKINL